MKRFKVTLFLLLLVSFGYFATDIYVPSLPALAVYFDSSESAAQMTLFSFIISFSVTPLIFGPLSDTIGRKKVALIGLLTALISAAGCYFSPSMGWLIVARFFQGGGAGAVVIAGRALIPDLYKGKEMAKQISYVTICMPFILTIAPMIGGLIQQHYGWHRVFLFLGIYTAILTVITWFKSENFEKRRNRTVSEVITIYRGLICQKTFMLFTTISALPAIGLFAYVTASPFLLQNQVGLTPSQYGLLSIFFGLTIICTGFLNTRLIKSFELHSIIFGGWIILVLAGITMGTFHLLGWLNIWTIVAPSLMYITCISLVSGNAVTLAMGELHEHYGSANAILGCLQFLFGALGCLLLSVIPELTILPLALIYLSVGIVTAFIHSLTPTSKPSQ